MAPFVLILALFTGDSTPKHGDTIVFVGDSITQAGHYVADVEAYILACRPNDYFRVVNVGKSSETVSGTSEPDHHPPRPCIHDRFARDVAAFKPNIVVACYGMNDGNYFPWDEERFEKYKSGMTRFIDRVFKETPARALVLLTPPPFDSSNAPPPPDDGKTFGYKRPSRNYDGVLRKYSDWLLTLRSERVAVVDVHRELHLEMRERNKGKETRTSFSPDAVHPNRVGHWLIARALLLDWTVRPSWRELTLDVHRPHASLSWSDGWYKWTTPPVSAPVSSLCRFPLASRPSGDASSNLNGELFRQVVMIKGSPKVSERALIDFQSREALRLTSDHFVRSATLLGSSLGFDNADTAHFSSLVQRRRSSVSAAWLAAQKEKPLTDLKLSLDAIQKAEEDVQSMTKAIDEARKPRSHEIVIRETVVR